MELLIATRFAWWPLATSSKRVNDYDETFSPVIKMATEYRKRPRPEVGIYSDKVFSLILRMYLFLFFFR